MGTEKIIKEEKILRITSFMLIEDVWEWQKALGKDNGEIWNTQIAPHKIGTLVKVIKILEDDGFNIQSCEEVTDEMIKEAFKGDFPKGEK